MEAALDSVLEAGNEYLEVDEATEALAAAETIARLQGNWGVQDAYTESVDTWVRKTKCSFTQLNLVLHSCVELPTPFHYKGVH